MASLTYHGNHGTQVVVEEYTFNTGEATEVPDELAHRLTDEYPGVFTSGDSPAKSARKEVWEAYRAAQGHNVEGLTRDELVDLPDVPVSTKES